MNLRRASPVLALALIAAIARADSPLPPPPAPPLTPAVKPFASAAAALAEVLAVTPAPRIIAFGEYHQTKGSAPATSALRHFIADLFPLLRPRAADLVVETWVTAGKCGSDEKAVVKDVEKTTRRPAATEDELVTLLRRAKEAGVQPHILTISCEDYRSLQPEGGGVDYEKMLRLVSTHLEAEIRKALGRHPADFAGAVVSYGGALHNDLYPRAELADFTFGRSLQALTRGRYAEVDLYVPEYIRGDRELAKEAWFAAAQREARAGRASLVTRGPGSYAIVFPATPR